MNDIVCDESMLAEIFDEASNVTKSIEKDT